MPTVNVLVTMPFAEALLGKIRAVSPEISVTRTDAERADYDEVDVLYTMAVPRRVARAPRLKWVQLHMAGPDSLHEHPIYTESAVALTTTSGVHAGTIAEYAITVMLALAHRVPRMVEWRNRGGWPPDAQRWPLFVPTEIRGATLGLIGYGSIGRELARIAKSAFGMTVLACKRDPKQRRDSSITRGDGHPECVLPYGVRAPGCTTSRPPTCGHVRTLTRGPAPVGSRRRDEAVRLLLNVGAAARWTSRRWCSADRRPHRRRGHRPSSPVGRPKVQRCTPPTTSSFPRRLRFLPTTTRLTELVAANPVATAVTPLRTLVDRSSGYEWGSILPCLAEEAAARRDEQEQTT